MSPQQNFIKTNTVKEVKVSAGIKESLGRLNGALQSLETAITEKSEEIKLREHQQDLFNAEVAQKATASAVAMSADLQAQDSIDPAILAQRLDSIIDKVEQVMGDA